MLRRRLLSRVGLLIGGFVVGAIVAIWALQGALAEIDRTNRDAAALLDGIQKLSDGVGAVEAARAPGATGDRAAALASATRRIDEAMSALGAHPSMRDKAGAPAIALDRLRRALPALVDPDADSGQAGVAGAPDPSMAVRSAVDDLAAATRAHVATELSGLGLHFRTLVLGLTLAALVMVNVSVIALLRTAHVVLKPVGALIEGSRELAAEHFDHRVEVGEEGEFAELAHAYNRLAEQLQANEERKTETVRQLAVALSHDLNNAMAIIEMQLGLLDRQAGGRVPLARELQDIRATLARMSNTVGSLRNIRRIVLTDYLAGEKMLDLERCVAPGPGSPGATEHAA